MDDRKYMTECMARDLVLLLMERRGLALGDALRALYSSAIYSKLEDPSTGLYFQSPLYVYAYLDKELATGKIS